jgi:hypothetical protein
MKYLFEGPEPDSIYASSSTQREFQIAKDKAGITKAVGFPACAIALPPICSKKVQM